MQPAFMRGDVIAIPVVAGPPDRCVLFVVIADRVIYKPEEQLYRGPVVAALETYDGPPPSLERIQAMSPVPIYDVMLRWAFDDPGPGAVRLGRIDPPLPVPDRAPAIGNQWAWLATAAAPRRRRKPAAGTARPPAPVKPATPAPLPASAPRVRVGDDDGVLLLVATSALRARAASPAPFDYAFPNELLAVAARAGLVAWTTHREGTAQLAVLVGELSSEFAIAGVVRLAVTDRLVAMAYAEFTGICTGARKVPTASRGFQIAPGRYQVGVRRAGGLRFEVRLAPLGDGALVPAPTQLLVVDATA